MRTVTKKEMIDTIAVNKNIHQYQVREVIEDFLEMIVEELEEGNRIEFRGFGVFEVKKRAAKLGRNPKTGETVSVPPRLAMKFRPGKSFKERINSKSI